MSARAPRRKPSGKGKKPPAIPRPDHDAKAIEGSPAQKDAPPALDILHGWMERISALPRLEDIDVCQLSESEYLEMRQVLELHEARRLLEDLEKTAQELSRLSDSALETIDSIKLRSVVLGCFDILEKNSKVGGEKAKEAVDILVNVIHRGCTKLAGAATHERSQEVLKTCASKQPKWPVMLSLRDSSYQEAKKYLGQIGVGTASTPPTAKTRISQSNPWTKRAVRLIHKIVYLREVLEKQARKEASLGRLLLGYQEEKDEFFEAELVEASAWKQVLDLPPELNKATWCKWWDVAEAILEADWKANPAEKNEAFKSVERSAKSLIRTKSKDPVTLARSLETESKNLIIKSVREAFKAIVARRKPS